LDLDRARAVFEPKGPGLEKADMATKRARPKSEDLVRVDPCMRPASAEGEEVE